ncbi:hypothetical protein DFP74_4011 [Nocardiopsis sp. Huas11]|uniref:hypothetical protein n=1 Tax=Nocardiopsis sp. Huas11 TaxID=2183912 RepID=UPI000F1CCA5C|nr:hypothetical protein [Nocardiopsis sp. Huas11]RKS08315.1 hypothetical protein DFP74_4011 [Nocardiopsis sp. Huas11]
MKRLTEFLRIRLGLPKDDGGYSTETVVVIALLVAMAIVAVGFISTTVTTYAQNITL